MITLNRTETIPSKQFVGIRQRMSFAANSTPALWRTFMPRRNEIRNTIDETLVSLQVYPPGFFVHFNPQIEFDKWALREVTAVDDIPAGMSHLRLPGGLYAVFNYRGSSADARAAYEFIFQKWLPQSIYLLDNRPQFELLGSRYKRDHPDSEEEIWIPVVGHTKTHN